MAASAYFSSYDLMNNFIYLKKKKMFLSDYISIFFIFGVINIAVCKKFSFVFSLESYLVLKC